MDLRREVAALKSKGVTPGLAVILIGEDPASRAYVRSKDKMSRVHAFSVPVEHRIFRLRGVDAWTVHPSQQELFDAMTAFPFGEHDDLLDAAASGTAYLLEKPEPRVW